MLLACFAVSSVLLVTFPAIDIEVSRLFFDQGFPWGNRWWQPLLRDSSIWFLCLSMLAVMGIYALNRWTRQRHWQVDGKKVVYLFLVLILGAGLIVNLALKNNFGRARPEGRRGVRRHEDIHARLRPQQAMHRELLVLVR